MRVDQVLDDVEEGRAERDGQHEAERNQVCEPEVAVGIVIVRHEAEYCTDTEADDSKAETEASNLR